MILHHKTYFWRDVVKHFGFCILQDMKIKCRKKSRYENKMQNACSGLLVRELSFDSYQVGLGVEISIDENL